MNQETITLTPMPSGVLSALLAGYRSVGGFDSLLGDDGELRPHWHALLENFARLGLDGISQRGLEAQRLLHENGVTFNGRALGSAARSWRVDPLPLVIDSHEWPLLEAGLAQRARLLDALLRDLYGEQRTLREGLIPAEALFQQGWWLPPCQHSFDTERAALFSLGVDLVRDSEGRWRVIADRVQSQAGSGYALENRIVLARSMPNLYRDAPLRRLAGALADEHRALVSLAPQHREHPNVVLLTAGPGSDGYLEHAYLASYLNLPLVESLDLVVRDQRVWMRTLGGLKPVDVILRRMSDVWCDPLELRADSVIGVAGLAQAARAGNVRLANPIGSCVLEHPVLEPYWQALCERLLGEPLLLEGPEGWWCGAPDALERTLDELPGLILRSFEPGAAPVHAARLDAQGLARLRQRIVAHPDEFVAQRPLAAASGPVFDAERQRLVPKPLSLRMFCSLDSSTADGSLEEVAYRVMPGGLAWVGEPGHPSVNSEVVKDVWVLADSPQPHVSQLRQASEPLLVTRDGIDLPSRVADSLFWLGRYGERLDNRARLLREALVRLLEQDQSSVADPSLDGLLEALELEPLEAQAEGEQRFGLIRARLLSLFSPDAPDGLTTLARAVHRNSQAVRDHLGDDAWRVLNNVGEEFERCTSASVGRRACERTVPELAAFFGLCNETMPHHYGWRLMDIGRFIERCQNTLALLRLALVDTEHNGAAAWEMVLATTDNFTAYRRRYRSELHPSAILDLLLFDEGNPRSVGYMLKRLRRQIDHLPQPSSAPYRSSEQRLVIRASTTLQLADVAALAGLPHSPSAREALSALLDALLDPLGELSEAVSNSHFAHVETPRQLLEMQVQP
ncbi:circularly permuted type 2 ATP-grasp protein [Halotalea alkalilenta]|uniref:circularly permuted type 2 ATP-grasp protein n=1 Tax=Halotalea alkalilenta TaxID=376489 RepID=UPI000484F2BF|nr:circularly permuted type 2 ATP-grasp protein [Halotalea alkalilenta]